MQIKVISTRYFSIILPRLWICFSLLWTLILTTGSPTNGIESEKKKPLNILLLLADDLGYGDTSVEPFVGSEIQTPNLERMASRGLLMTNFHTAAATCSPTRASILTGLYPWRLGIKAVFEYGAKGHESNRDDWLIQAPTVATLFRDAQYSTFHSGKWHVSGMRYDDLDRRNLPLNGTEGTRSCQHPGPNQQGFQEYVSLLDGPGSPRQNELQTNMILYSMGCSYLIHNDRQISNDYNNEHFNITGWLTDCEASHAMRMMKQSVALNKPFYMQVWFHSPHGPWQEHPGYNGLFPLSKSRFSRTETSNGLPSCIEDSVERQVEPRYCQKPELGGINDEFIKDNHKEYRSMVSDLDKHVGRILDSLRDMGIEKHTLVVFMSDNGPELFRGTTGGLRGRKRDIYEGGIRVPAIFQWPGTIPAGMQLNTFGLSTDLLPTFLEAADIEIPPSFRHDGVSLLPELLHPELFGGRVQKDVSTDDTSLNSVDRVKKIKRKVAVWPMDVLPDDTHRLTRDETVAKKQQKKIKNSSDDGDRRIFQEATSSDKVEKRRRMLQDRVVLWQNDYEGPKRTSAILYNFKVILDENNSPFEMFDLVIDPLERKNLIPDASKFTAYVHEHYHHQGHRIANQTAEVDMVNNSGGNHLRRTLLKSTSDTTSRSRDEDSILTMLSTNRSDKNLHRQIVVRLYRALLDWSMHGNEAHVLYKTMYNLSITYPASYISDNRHVGQYFSIMSPPAAQSQRIRLLQSNSCNTSEVCQCGYKSFANVVPLPFESVHYKYLNPHGFANASDFLDHHYHHAQ